ncbi:MAG: hypothetical protein BWX60_00991 [Candidatus Marinimicrobia bacterium ADurb.Bin030]|nr:MAG: hypothetical protein BWX60_00991 [Candidatus Marinimicrobia bacterium ADurb.Bin030]
MRWKKPRNIISSTKGAANTTTPIISRADCQSVMSIISPIDAKLSGNGKTIWMSRSNSSIMTVKLTETIIEAIIEGEDTRLILSSSPKLVCLRQAQKKIGTGKNNSAINNNN